MCTQKTEIKREPNPPKINTSAFKRAPHGQRQSVKQPGKSASRCTEAFAGVAGSYHPDLSLSRSLLFLKWLWTIKQTPKKTSSEEPFFFYYVHILSATGFFLLERGMVHLRLLLGLKKREKRGGRGRKKKHEENVTSLEFIKSMKSRGMREDKATPKRTRASFGPALTTSEDSYTFIDLPGSLQQILVTRGRRRGERHIM